MIGFNLVLARKKNIGSGISSVPLSVLKIMIISVPIIVRLLKTKSYGFASILSKMISLVKVKLNVLILTGLQYQFSTRCLSKCWVLIFIIWDYIRYWIFLNALFIYPCLQHTTRIVLFVLCNWFYKKYIQIINKQISVPFKKKNCQWVSGWKKKFNKSFEEVLIFQ